MSYFTGVEQEHLIAALNDLGLTYAEGQLQVRGMEVNGGSSLNRVGLGPVLWLDRPVGDLVTG
jgi:hypothetical protein